MTEGVNRGPSSDSILCDLRRQLELVHVSAGKPTVRAISEKVGGISHTTVHKVLLCKRIPTWGQLELVVQALGGEIEDFKNPWVAYEAAVKRERSSGEMPNVTRRRSVGYSIGRGTGSGEDIYEIAVVSCDIVGHSSEILHSAQTYRVKRINEIITGFLNDFGTDSIEWTSGGDGGHIVFRNILASDAWWKGATIALIERLQAWSEVDSVKIRITAHIGIASHFLGVGNRIQFVGDGMNVAGWLLDRGGPDGVVVSESFRRAIGDKCAELGVTFHDPRILRDKKFTDQHLLLMSISARQSQWYLPKNEDRDQLSAALNAVEETRRGLSIESSRYSAQYGPNREGWELLLYAKRIMQVNKNDTEARRALARLSRLNLQCYTDDGEIDINPFFADLGPTLLGEVIESGELVQRQYNEVICQRGDEGDTMFVILRGRVGVYKKAGKLPNDSITEPAYSHQEGEVVGELAFALARNRTADLVALTDTVLLAFNYKQLERYLSKDVIGDLVKQRVAQFIVYRVLQHVSEKVTYLAGPDRSGPLCMGKETLKQTLTYLQYDCRLLSFDYGSAVDNNALRDSTSTHPTHSWDGLYILVGGSLASNSDQNIVVNGDNFPLLWASLSGGSAMPAPNYCVKSDEVKLLYIASAGLDRLGAPRKKALIDTISQADALIPVRRQNSSSA